MSVNMSFSELVNGVAQLDFNDYEKFVATVNKVRARQRPDALSKKEAALLEKINQGFPVEKWLRMQYLDGKMEEGILPKIEYDELTVLTTAYEKYCIQRIQLIKKLALHRNLSLEATMKQLGLNHGKV